MVPKLLTKYCNRYYLNFDKESSGKLGTLGLPDYRIDVIALRAEYRNPKLASSLNSIGVVFESQGGYRWTRSDDIRISHEFSLLVNGSELSNGEIGCAIAHLKSYKRFLDSSEKLLVVIEDDAVMKHWFDLERFTSLMDTDVPHVLLLGRNVSDLPILKRPVEKFGSTGIFVDNLPPTGTFAYIINRAAADLLVREYDSNGVNFTADWPLSAVEKAVFLYCFPPLFSSGNSASLIERPASVNRVRQISSFFHALRSPLVKNRSFWKILHRLLMRHARIRLRRLVSNAWRSKPR